MELIEIIENEIDGIVWVTERYGFDSIIYSENTYPKNTLSKQD